MFFPVTYERSIKEKLSIDFAEPTNKLITFESLSVCMNRYFLTYFRLKSSKLDEKCLALRFKFTYSVWIVH